MSKNTKKSSKKNQKKTKLIAQLPIEVTKIFDIFGDQIRLVGGSVRDLLLKKEISDFDFATILLPNQVTKILAAKNIKVIPTGLKYGTVTAVVGKKNFEITTLRKDQNQNGRHCDVQFVDDYFLDALRRDFTINALYLDCHGLVHDYFEGIADLKKGLVKFVGDPNERIKEDALRILRFFRFSCNFSNCSQVVDSKGFEACVSFKESLRNLSRERIRGEFFRLINSLQKENLLQVLHLMNEGKIFAEIFSRKLNLISLKRLFELEKLLGFESSLYLKVATLFFDESVFEENFFKEICSTNLEKKYFKSLNRLASFGKNFEPSLNFFYKKVAFENVDFVLDFFLLCATKSLNQDLEEFLKINFKFLQRFTLPKFPLSGDDLKGLKLEGARLGEALTKAKIHWAESSFLANKDALLNFLAFKSLS